MSKTTTETLRADFRRLERNPAWKRFQEEIRWRHSAAIKAIAQNADAPEPQLRAAAATLSVWETVQNLPDILVGIQAAEDELAKAEADADEFDA